MKLVLPEVFDESEALVFAGQLSECWGEPELLLDFSNVQFVYPFGTLAIAIAIKEVWARRRLQGLKLSVRGHDRPSGAISYLRFFGFFKYIKLNVGNDVGEAPGSSRYIPVSVINKTNLDVTDKRGAALQDEVETTSDRLAKVLFPGNAEELARYMTSYCFRELVRNAFEHAVVQKCVVMAQRWNNGEAEVAIGDRGIGIATALSWAHPVESAEAAVKMALKPGISGSSTVNSKGNWANSGFGLYVVSEMGRRYGSFSIASSGYAYNVNSGAGATCNAIRGTLVKLRISTKDAEYWPNILKSIVDEGERIAAKTPGAIRTASTGSRSSKSIDIDW